MQFLGEATVLSAFGGGVGVGLGIVASNVISSTLRWPTLVPWGALVIDVIFSAMLLGIFFGYYPAHKAAHLDPIDALRYE
jgi:putative ABC transport system permease protein